MNSASKSPLPRRTRQQDTEANPNASFYESIAGIYDLLYEDVDADEAHRQWSLLVRRCTGLPRPCQAQIPRLLDVGCGTGRYLVPWARAGFLVTGIDASKRMIARAEARRKESGWASRIRLVCGDVRRRNPRLDKHGPFAVAVAHFNFLNLFAPRELEDVLSSLRGCMERGGRLFADVAPPSLLPEGGRERLALGGMTVEVEISPDRASGVVTKRYRLGGEWTEERYWLHSTATLRRAAKAAGWQLESVHGWHPDCPADPWGPGRKGRGHRVYVFRAL